uniref:Putative beta-carotenoid oxygenase n=1 Tax=Suberites domuncula TaxID=55567 RepID=H8WQM9_SUBDO|nr:putative beta-carotenoid oxygenase [Suberites domuncula]
MAHAASPGESSANPDLSKPIDVKKLRKGWHASPKEEYDYWVPDADIEGSVPLDLKGTFLRNGPGLLEVYGTKLKHPIDGDGMVVALTFIEGRVHLRAKFVATKERLEEQRERKLIYRGQMGTNPNSAVRDTAVLMKNFLTLSWPTLRFRNPSNTNVFYWGGKILTVYETKYPHCLDPHTLETLGEETLNGALTLKAFAAHFRLDMRNKRLVCFGVVPGVGSRKPSLAIYEFDDKWNLMQYQMHHIDGLNYAHDFLLLRDYYVFHMTPFADMTFTAGLKVFAGLSSPGELMKYYSHMPSRFVVIPRHKGAAHQDIKLLNTEPCHIFHFGNAVQKDNDTITFNAVCLGPKFNMTFEREMWLSNASVAPGNMYKFTLDLSKSTCVRSKDPADPANVEYPTVHPYRHGLSTSRYSYLMSSDRTGYKLPYRDVVKHDLKGGTRQVWYSQGCVGEPVFVPRLGWASIDLGDDDDGYVVVQLYIPEKHITEFAVLDAKHVDQGPLARIKLKHHILYGFHGTSTPEVFVGDSHVPKASAKL